jgi:RNA polymerase sigma-70 factor (ECF subfamily)
MDKYSTAVALLLFEQASKGNTHAFATIVKLYEEKLKHCIENYIPVNDAFFDDIIQETWITIWRQSNSIKDKKNPLSWVLKIGRNIAISHIRKQKRFTNLDATQEDKYHPHPHAENTFAQHHYLLVKALEGLSKRQQELVVLRFVNNLSYKDIARICNLSPHTVRNHLSRAIKNLRIKIHRFLCWVLVLINELETQWVADIY